MTQVVSWNTCARYYRNINRDLICTLRNSAFDNDADTCSGDSGSYVGTQRNGHYELDGVVSFGAASGCEDTLSANAEVIKYLDWIAANMDGDIWE